MIRLAIVMTFLLITAANAQQPQQPTPHDMVMGQRILNEVNANIQCETNAMTLRQELIKAQERVKELEAKYEPKKDTTPHDGH